jgi:cytidylate kinase
MIITISRQYASGGGAVAKLVADALGWTLADNEFVEAVAARAGLPQSEVAEREERVPGFVERLAATLALSSPELVGLTEPEAAIPPELRLVRITESVVNDLAARGRVVMVGRATPAVLSREDEAIHVKIVAPVDSRIRRAIERLGVDPKQAAKRIHEVDAQRQRYHREYYDRDCNDPANYHMVLNTTALGLEGAAELVLARARALGWVDRGGIGEQRAANSE